MAKMYESRCETCNSPHREEIEEKRLEENWSYNRISDWLDEEYDVQLTRQALARHFNKHVLDSIKKMRKSEARAQDIADSEVTETLNLIDQLKESISILKRMLNRMLKSQNELSSAEVNSITKCLSEIRLTVKELNNLTGSLEVGELTQENSREKFFSFFIDNIDNETAEKVIEAWKKAEEETDGNGDSKEQD